MVMITQEMIKQFQKSLEEIDEPFKIALENMHQGYRTETLVRFLKARDGNISKARQMLLDCLDWRIRSDIDIILSKPILPTDLYRRVRDTQLIGMSGYSKEGLPVIAVGVGLSTYDEPSISCKETEFVKSIRRSSEDWDLAHNDRRVNSYVQSHIQINEFRDHVIMPFASKKFGRNISTCLKILDMTGLKFSALNHIKLLTVISTIDDLNYPEKTDTYYIVNAPYIFSACWKVVKPLLQERTRKKIQVLPGCGRDDLLKVMDYASLPHFCRREGSGSSRHSRNGTTDNCFSLDHAFHQQLYNYIKQQAALTKSSAPVKQGSFHVDFPEPAPGDTKIAETIESELQRLGNQNGLRNLKINGD